MGYIQEMPELESRAELVIKRLKNGESRSENSKNDSK